MESQQIATTVNTGRFALSRLSALPVAKALNPALRRLLYAGFGALLALMLADAAHIAFGLGGWSWESAMRGGAPGIGFTIVAALVSLRAYAERHQRLLWSIAAAGLWSYAIAMLLWGFWLQHVKSPPDPSICDFFWWAFYLLSAIALVGAGSHHAPRLASLTLWLDGLMAAATTAAVATAFVLPPIVNSSKGAHQAVFANLLYPVGDLVLGVLLVAVVGMRGWRLDRRWGALLIAFLLLLSADFTDSIEVTHGAITGDSADTLVYLAAFTAIAVAAWQPGRTQSRDRSTPHWLTLVLPAIFGLIAPAILIYDHFSRVPLAAFILTMVAMIGAALRLAMALRDMLTLSDMRHAALTDELTDLPNRRMFFADLRRAMAEVKHDGGTLTALMFDLDNFKQLNDTLGHDAGDDLLRMIGPRLAGSVRAGDVVARLGGDEFAILLARGADPCATPQVAEAVLRSLREPFRVHGVSLRLTASVGIATYPQDANTPEALIKCMDVAMYDAKRSRRGWEEYASERDQNTRERLQMSDALASALENGAIEAHLQPIVDTETRTIVGAEALVRWRQPDGSVRAPGDFLDVMEMAGLSRALTRRMIDLALGSASGWQLACPTPYVAVNVTASDLLDETFPDEVEAALLEHGVPASSLMVEMTESSILADPGRAVKVLDRLHCLGVRLALDDFGTGYSSLTHLRDLPVDMVKIDRSFVSRMCDEGADAAIVYATIELAHRLKLEVTAEGVEDERTWAALSQISTDRVQGYCFSRPLPPDEFRALLAAAPGYALAASQSLPTPASTASRGSIV